MDEKVKVYNFEVEGNHNYYVSEKGILVHNNCEWTSAITNTLENASSGLKNISQNIFLQEVKLILEADHYHGTIGTSAQGARQIILDFGRTINESGTTSQVRIWMNET
ncbi:hypothetical protein [Chryseobacterium sp. GVT01B]|uniref:hypothetical protein n=1 Tax=Chryseobacterium sp. GVT01B TaxID=2862675 RepID=UPI001CBF423E|nr:hypothetical protein [Chryseobacterium sp. GVT01B]